MTINVTVKGVTIDSPAIPISGWERKYTEDWSHVGHCGKTHSWLPNQVGKKMTFARVVEDSYYCFDCQDEHSTYEWRCRVCGEKLEPATENHYVHTLLRGPVDTTIEFWSWEYLQIGEEYEIEGEKGPSRIGGQVAHFRGRVVPTSMRSDRGSRLYTAAVMGEGLAIHVTQG